MPRPLTGSAYISLFVLACALVFSPVLPAQEPAPASQTAAPAAAPAYPDTPAGLEALLKDILDSAKAGKAADFGAQIQRLAEPPSTTWYAGTFGKFGKEFASLPENAGPKAESSLNEFFLRVLREKADAIEVRKHEQECDDRAGELVYPVMLLRENQTPLYEVFFHYGEEFERLWAIVYAGGQFHFAGNLKPSNFHFYERTPAGPQEPSAPAAPGERIMRIRQGGLSPPRKSSTACSLPIRRPQGWSISPAPLVSMC